MKLYETINAENWSPHGRIEEWALDQGCLLRLHFIACGQSHEKADKSRPDLIRAIKALYPERVFSRGVYVIEDFNDHPDTTVEDVIRVCKVADV